MALRVLRGWMALGALRGLMGALIINYNKMKLFRISLSLFVVCAVFFSSCIAEGEHYCPEERSLHLFFQYYENEQDNRDPVDVFVDNVDVVDIFVFDVTGQLAIPPMRRTIEQLQSARNFRGTRTTRPGVELVGLQPGHKYRVVAWGNTRSERQPFNQEATVDNAYYATNPQGGTPLHFGPGSLTENPTEAFWITMPATQTAESEVLEFSRAHTTLQIFVVGADFVPGVEVTDIARGISFDNEHLSGSRISFNELATQQGYTPEQNSRPAQITTFYTPIFNYDTDKNIVIRNSGNVLDNGAFSLSDALDGHGVVLNDTNFPEMIVPIIIEVGDNVVVNVIIPGWIVDPRPPVLW